MKKRTHPALIARMLNAAEAAQISAANPGAAAQKDAQERAAFGTKHLREALLEIEASAALGLTEARIDGNGVTFNALRGMGYRVTDSGRMGLLIVARWDARPKGFWGGLWWGFINKVWRDPA